MTIEKENKLF